MFCVSIRVVALLLNTSHKLINRWKYPSPAERTRRGKMGRLFPLCPTDPRIGRGPNIPTEYPETPRTRRYVFFFETYKSSVIPDLTLPFPTPIDPRPYVT